MISELKRLNHLKKIIDFIKSEGGSATWTKIKRYSEVPDDFVSDCVEFGRNNGYIVCGDYNVYSIIKDVNIGEENFYKAINYSIYNLWKKEKFQENEYYIENTSRVDSKIAGPWTRPDLTLVSYRRYPWTIGEEFDVVSFEVKKPETSNVLAVFEALSHRTAATRSYAVFPIDENTWESSDPAQAARVRDECSKHGVGLILVEKIFENPTAKHVIRAQRNEIDHEKCSDFLQAVMSSNGKNKIATWKR